jgi:hypothetical protein
MSDQWFQKLSELDRFTFDGFGNLKISSAGSQTAPIAASKSTDTVIKGTPGRLATIIVTTTGSHQMDIYDNATTGAGTIIGSVPANATVGSQFTADMPAAAGITAKGNAANPGVTVSFD